ncbi:MAG: inositol-3-phosphate synthase [Candidatus Nanoarchaeia archaeon]|nr:inositol-3-phosphate synthase [Candidatus Nanoarchaeia archaeon]MDD5740938.1 inositol-3-phosphate synthase [Candidatus Nanoarchaeia archaeon]
MKKINVGIIGVGSFTKALVEGVSFYTKNPNETIGLINPLIGEYKVKDINFVCAFDVDERKVGKKLHEAISAGSNITKEITKPLKYNADVYRGPTLDGVIKEMRESFVRESSAPVADVVKILKENKTDIVVNLVPSGSDQATLFYAEAALKARCSFINCIPTSLATNPKWRKQFENKGLVLLGDDIKSQLGATMLNRLLLEILKMRGIKVTKSEQINRGGNADHFNLLYRFKHKEKSKSEALKSFLGKDDAKPTVGFFYTGEPSGHKLVNIRIEGEIFGRTPIVINSLVEDEISINGAGTVVDAIRIARLLVDRKTLKEAKSVCPFLMKSPPEQMSDQEGFRAFQKTLKKV